MPSPFPGMDPYLEGYLWPDVHHALVSKIRQLLVPHLSPNAKSRSIALLEPMRVKIVTVEIRDTVHHRLITSIEILSPVNKREPNITQYRAKRQRLYDANVHPLELDLIRRGTRPIQHPSLPDSLYLVTLTLYRSIRCIKKRAC
jgi:Protein of unknown function (DUF4058)